jgi:hypothetical protein
MRSGFPDVLCKVGTQLAREHKGGAVKGVAKGVHIAHASCIAVPVRKQCNETGSVLQ